MRRAPRRVIEPVTLPPMFVLQGELDDNVLPAVQERFAASYRAAGGEIDFEIYPGCEHRWIIQPGPQTDRAIEMIKAFIVNRTPMAALNARKVDNITPATAARVPPSAKVSAACA